MKNVETISVIVPCYNEEASLPTFYRQTSRVLRQMEKEDGICWELILVDDGSSDRTQQVIKSLGTKDQGVRYVIFSRNFGKEAAMYAGLQEARGDYCVLMDADLQHPPTLLPQMYQTLKETGADCCGGQRIGREGDGRLRSLLSRCFYRVCSKLTHMDMIDGHGDFRMMRRQVVDAILQMGEYHRYMKGIFSFVGFDTRWIPYENVERKWGESKWNFGSLFRYAGEGILSFSTTLLKLPTVLCPLLLVAAAGCGLWWAIGGQPQGLLLVAVLLLLGSLQMAVFSIFGAYLAKDYMENKGRPIYIVKERSGVQSGQEKRIHIAR